MDITNFNKHSNKFVPRVIGEAKFTGIKSDMHFRIVQISKQGTCMIEDVKDPRNKLNHASTPAKAWASIRYQAGINHYTERSQFAPETEKPQKPIVVTVHKKKTDKQESAEEV